MNGMKGEHWEGETKGPFILDDKGEEEGGWRPNRQSRGEAHKKENWALELEHFHAGLGLRSPLKGSCDHGTRV